MALAQSTNQIKKEELFVANTSNVKEMKNGRPVSVLVEEELPNCTIVTLLAPVDDEENDHVYKVDVVEDGAEIPARAFVIVAPEIMVEEARKTDGHIGKFRLKPQEVYTAYELHKGDRLEFSENYTQVTEANATKVSERATLAQGMILAPNKNLYAESELKMIKFEIK